MSHQTSNSSHGGRTPASITTNDIEKEPAGRRLDSWVAEKVMGWKRIDRKAAGWGDGPQVWATGDDSEDGSPTIQWFEPSTDWGCAGKVVEKLPGGKVKGLRLRLIEYTDGFYAVFAAKMIDEADWQATQIDTAPHAICLAALKAVDIQCHPETSPSQVPSSSLARR